MGGSDASRQGVASGCCGGSAHAHGLWVFNRQACERTDGHDNLDRGEILSHYDNASAPDDHHRRALNDSGDSATDYRHPNHGCGRGCRRASALERCPRRRDRAVSGRQLLLVATSLWHVLGPRWCRGVALTRRDLPHLSTKSDRYSGWADKYADARRMLSSLFLLMNL